MSAQITDHAIARYQQRIAPQSSGEARAVIARGIANAQHYQPTRQGSLRMWCPEEPPFRAVLSDDGGGGSAIVSVAPWKPWERNPPGIDLGRMLRVFRKRCGLSMARVAQHLGVSMSSVSHWERGIVHPARDRIEAMCALYKLGSDALEWHMRLVGHAGWSVHSVPNRRTVKAAPRPNDVGELLGKLLRRYRARRNLTQTQAHNRIPGAGKTALWLYESGRRIPPGRTLTAMLDLYHVTHEDFMRDYRQAGLRLQECAPWEAPRWTTSE